MLLYLTETHSLQWLITYLKSFFLQIKSDLLWRVGLCFYEVFLKGIEAMDLHGFFLAGILSHSECEEGSSLL